MLLPVTCIGKGQACQRCVLLASNNGALEPGSSRDTRQILEVPGQPAAMMVSDETKSPSLGSGANCNSEHTSIYLAEKWDWANVNKISLVHLASLRQLLILEKQREGTVSPDALSCPYISGSRGRLKNDPP